MSKFREYLAHPGRKQMFYLLMTLVLFVVLDGILTEYLIGGGLAREANGFLAPLVGKAGFMVLKIFGSLFCALVLWDIYRRMPRVAMITTWIAVVGYGLVVLWNTSLFLLV